ncbi:MAG: M20/M25/M40 family metallo-hydrolase [Planctomycetota bacterium]
MLPFLLAALALPALPQGPLEAARAWRERNGAEILREFAGFLALPNLASDPEGIGQNAEWIADAFRKRGARVRIERLPGAAPIVLVRIEAEGARRTLGFYAHFDGQPVDEARWTRPPWTPALLTRSLQEGGTERPFPRAGEPVDPEWRLFARSAGDDKAPFLAFLAALDALRAAGRRPSSNLVFLFEGEEEAGSPHLGLYLDKFPAELGVDAWLFCDGPGHQSGRPQLVFGVRGITGLEITVYGADRYLHSGHYGNWAPNPALRLARLLAGMKDENGRVRIAGFYDSVTPLGESERTALKKVPLVGPRLRREFGLAESEAGDAPYLERLLLPSLNIRGLSSATVGATARNVVPPTATASIDIRLVKGNDPGAMLDLVEAHIRKKGFFIVRSDPDRETRRSHSKIAKVVREKGYPAARTSMENPLARKIAAAARQAAGGELVLLPTLGGSLPLYLFTGDPGRAVLVVPIANFDDNQYGPDENLRIGNLWYGIDLFAALFAME